MHLLAAQAGAIQHEGEAIDLGQSPAPIVFASAADSELALLAGAADRAGFDGLRCASMLRLAHNLSVDLWIEKTVRHARLVVVRLLGGPSYWPYGVDELAALAMAGGPRLVLLPGDANPDPILMDRSGTTAEDWSRLHALFTAGGPENADELLAAFQTLAAPSPSPSPGGGEPRLQIREPKPFPRFGFWLPQTGVVETLPESAKPNIPLLFYRAALEGGGTATLEALVTEVARQGLNPVPVLVSSLKEPACVSFVRNAFRAHPPAAILNLTGFALGLDSIEEQQNPFAATDAPVIQLVQGGRPQAAWQADPQGLTAKDLAMQVVLPELDGRLGALLVGHKEAAVWHPRTQCPLSSYAPDTDGITRAVTLARNWARLRDTPRAARRVGIVLANYPIRDGRLANGVGYDAPQSTVEILRALEGAGYALDENVPVADPPTPDPSPQGGGEAGGRRPRHVSKASIRRGRSLRNGATPPERVVWSVLRRWEGAHFRRQVPIGPYFADFACHRPRLVIELDGETRGSDAAIAHDASRDAFLTKAGYRVLRFSNRDVATNLDGIWSAIDAALAAPSPPSPWRGGAGGGGAVASPRVPQDGNALIDLLQAGPTNAHPGRGEGIAFPLARYIEVFETLPAPLRAAVQSRWGDPAADPFCRNDAFHLPALRFGNVAIMLQPARGYDLDESAIFHDPDLVPPHGYIAAYLWLRHDFAAHALIHNGKHGSLEWLPGKAVALGAESWPLALWAELPHLYPFIVNDPGEGTQAKRRTGAVIVDHLVPPLTRAELYGPLKDLEAMLDEYYAASGMDRRRLGGLRRRILDYVRDARLAEDFGVEGDDDQALVRIDTFLCELKESQIRDGLHILGQSPTGRLERDLIVALVRVPRSEDAAGASLLRALADDLRLGFDPLTAKLGAPWTGPPVLADAAAPSPEGGGEGKARTAGAVVERLEDLAAALVEGTRQPEPGWRATRAVLETVETIVRPRLAACGPDEIDALLAGLDGRFVRPGPSGAPSRGRLDVLPTGRNFYSVDNRAVPTPTAWELGRKSAENLCARHFQDHGAPLAAVALSVWGTANMRTGGDDIAQALALIGARPQWDPGSLRVAGYEIVPLAKLGRARVDVTLRVSGFFRDAFPAQMALFDRAVRAIGALDEPDELNPIAARMRGEALALMQQGASEADAGFAAGHRIFGPKPGAYGAGLQGLIDSGRWQTKADLADTFLDWGQYAYGAKAAGEPERERLAQRLSRIDAVVHNQDNREHDLLDSDDYYQFEGGLAVTAETLSGRPPAIWHNDHSRPEDPRTRTLGEEIARVMRSRVVNPKWIDGVKRHGYKGAFEIIATVDYMFAFAATTGAVKSHHFDLAFAAFVEDETTAAFIRTNNRFGWDELLAKFREARERGFWTPRSNSAHALLDGQA